MQTCCILRGGGGVYFQCSTVIWCAKKINFLWQQLRRSNEKTRPPGIGSPVSCQIFTFQIITCDISGSAKRPVILLFQIYRFGYKCTIHIHHNWINVLTVQQAVIKWNAIHGKTERYMQKCMYDSCYEYVAQMIHFRYGYQLCVVC